MTHSATKEYKEQATVTVTEIEAKELANVAQRLSPAQRIINIERKHKPQISIDTVLEKPILTARPLPPKDTGKVAFQVLIAALFLESTACGLSLAYGVFQEYYTAKYTNHKIASWIGVLSEGIPFLGAPLVTFCCQKYAFPRQYYVWLGAGLCVAGLLSSAFLTTLPGLIVTQGLIYGCGVLLIDIPLLVILNTHFDKRRGLAYGIIFAGADIFGVAYTFLATFLLNKYSFRTTMLILTATTFICVVPPIFLLKERSEFSDAPLSFPPNNSLRRRSSALSAVTLKSATKISAGDIPFSPSLENRLSWPVILPKKRYYQRSIFYVYNFANILHACAFYLPLIYLPTFVTQFGHSQQSAALVLALFNIAQAVGDIGFGKLSDKFNVNLLIISCMAVTSVSSFLLWGVFGTGSNGLPMLLAYAFLFGVFGAGFLALWARMGTTFGDRDAQMVFSTLCFGRGIGCIASGPISQVLMAVGTPSSLRRLGGEQYGTVIMFVGTCLAASGLMGALAIFALWWKKERAVAAEDAPSQPVTKS